MSSSNAVHAFLNMCNIKVRLALLQEERGVSTLFLLLSQHWRLAKIWLSMAWTQESLSSKLLASKCHVCPVLETTMNSKFSSSVDVKEQDKAGLQLRLGHSYKFQLMLRTLEQEWGRHSTKQGGWDDHLPNITLAKGREGGQFVTVPA